MNTRVRLHSVRPAFTAAISLLVSPGLALPVPIPGAAPVPAAARASDLADIAAVFPAGSLILVAYPNLATFQTQFASSALYKIFQESQVQKFLEKPLAALRAALQGTTPNGIDDKMIASTFDGPAAIAVTGVRLPKPGTNETLDIGLVAYAKASTAEKLTTFRSTLGQLAQSRAGTKSEKRKIGDAEVETWTFAGSPIAVSSAQLRDRFFISISATALDSVLSLAAGKGSSLSSDAAFQKVSSRISTGEAPIMATYVSVEGILGLFQPIMPLSVRAAFDKSGIAGLKAIGLGTTVKDGAFIDSTFVYCPSPRTGILRCMQSEPLDLSHLAFVPKDITSFSMHRLSFALAWDSIWETIAAYDATVADQTKKVLADFEKQLGFAVKGDFIDSIGTELIEYSKPSATGFPEWMLLVELKNSQKFTDCIQKLTTKLPGVKIKEVPIGESGKAFYVDLSQLGPMAMFVQPCYGLAGNYLVVSINLQALKATLSNFGGKDRPTVRENEEFKAFFGSVPQGATSLSYTDTRRSFESFYNSIRAVLPMIAASVGSELPMDLALLPTSEAISKYLTPGIAYGTLDADGHSSRSRGTISTNLIAPYVFVIAALSGVMTTQAMRQINDK